MRASRIRTGKVRGEYECGLGKLTGVRRYIDRAIFCVRSQGSMISSCDVPSSSGQSEKLAGEESVVPKGSRFESSSSEVQRLRVRDFKPLAVIAVAE